MTINEAQASTIPTVLTCGSSLMISVFVASMAIYAARNKKTDANEFSRNLFSLLISLMQLQAPEQYTTGKAFDKRIYAKANKSDTPRNRACGYSHPCLQEVPPEGEILQAPAFLSMV